MALQNSKNGGAGRQSSSIRTAASTCLNSQSMPLDIRRPQPRLRSLKLVATSQGQVTSIRIFRTSSQATLSSGQSGLGPSATRKSRFGRCSATASKTRRVSFGRLNAKIATGTSKAAAFTQASPEGGLLAAVTIYPGFSDESQQRSFAEPVLPANLSAEETLAAPLLAC